MALLTLLLYYPPAATICFALAKCIYNVFFHPLCHYPGPLLARATRLYHIWYDLSGIQHLKQKQWHDTYGPVVRVAPDELSYNTAQAWIDIYGHRTQDRPASFEKDGGFFARESDVAHIVIANDADHRRFRRLQAHAFSQKALLAQQDVLRVHLDEFIRQLRLRATSSSHSQEKGGGGEEEEEEEEAVDLVQWLNFLTFDTIGDLAFGSPVGCLRQGQRSRYIDVIFSLVKISNYFRAARRFPSPLKQILMVAMLPRGLIDDYHFQIKFSEDKVEERMRLKTDRADLLSYILKENTDKNMTEREIQAAARIFIIAGSETTATLLSGAFFHLLTHREYLDRLTNEVRTAFRAEFDIDIQSTASLPFLQAVVQESLRLYPPAPNTFPRATPAPGQVICGRFVPAGTAVGVHQWSAHRCKTNFFMPDAFLPERWMGTDNERFQGDQRDACQPFSYGPRNCIGQNLANAEIRLTICRLLWNFDMQIQESCRNWLEGQKTFTLWEKEPLYVKLVTVDR